MSKFSRILVVTIAFAAILVVDPTFLLTAGSQQRSATELLIQFVRSKSAGQYDAALALLENAMQAVAQAEVPETSDSLTRAELRRAQTESWLRLITTIERSIDPRYGPKDDVVVTSPLNAPSDPLERALWEAARKAEAERNQRIIFETGLRRKSESAFGNAEVFIFNHFASSKEDQKELEAIIADWLSGLDFPPSLKDRIKRLTKAKR